MFSPGQVRKQELENGYPMAQNGGIANSKHTLFQH
jgi:hypothetical protein